MQLEQGSSKVEFHRLNTDIPIRYKFLSKSIDLGADQIFEGTTCRMSGGGCLLVGKVPSLNWIPALLLGKILVGVNVLLPQQELPVKALCRVGWIEAISEGSDRVTLGIQFVDIPKEGLDLITKYMIKSQMTSH